MKMIVVVLSLEHSQNVIHHCSGQPVALFHHHHHNCTHHPIPEYLIKMSDGSSCVSHPLSCHCAPLVGRSLASSSLPLPMKQLCVARRSLSCFLFSKLNRPRSLSLLHCAFQSPDHVVGLFLESLSMLISFMH